MSQNIYDADLAACYTAGLESNSDLQEVEFLLGNFVGSDSVSKAEVGEFTANGTLPEAVARHAEEAAPTSSFWDDLETAKAIATRIRTGSEPD